MILNHRNPSNQLELSSSVALSSVTHAACSRPDSTLLMIATCEEDEVEAASLMCSDAARSGARAWLGVGGLVSLELEGRGVAH